MNDAPFKFLALILVQLAAFAAEPAGRVPVYRTVEVLPVRVVPPAAGAYPAFPAMLPLAGNRALITYKAGQGHTHDPGAAVAVIELDFSHGTVREGPRLVPPAPLLFQCAEPIRLGDGRIALFIDTQRIGPEPRHYRVPMRWTVSSDEGKTFSAPSVFPVVDGVGYGYPQEGLTTSAGTYLMVMTFGYLAGERWSMDILHTADHGARWTRVRNLAEEFGVPGFNEGGMIPWGDGFLVASRSYDLRARVHEVDAQFRLRRTVDLTAESPWVASYMGRPRFLRHGGHTYLVGRNWTKADFARGQRTDENPLAFPAAQQLWLFRLDPVTLRPAAGWMLDNAEKAPVSDGYYAVGQTTGAPGDERLQIITYKAVAGGAPQLLRLEFRWRDFTD